MTWIYHDETLFNLDNFPVISLVGSYDISLSKAVTPDDDDYFTLAYESEEERDQAFKALKKMLFANNI